MHIGFQVYTLIDGQKGQDNDSGSSGGGGSQMSLPSLENLSIVKPGATSNPLLGHFTEEGQVHRKLFFTTEKDQISLGVSKELCFQGARKRTRWDRAYHDFSIVYEAGAKETYTLCHLRYYPNGWLEMTPGFTGTNASQYTQRNRAGDGTLFEFTMTNGTLPKISKEMMEDLANLQDMQYERQEENFGIAIIKFHIFRVE